MNDRPRSHHYAFVHRMIPSLLEARLEEIISIFIGKEGQNFLEAMWDKCGQLIEEGAPKLPSDGLSYFVEPRSEEPLKVVIQFPRPERITEGHMAALLVWRSGEYRYFILEFGVDIFSKENYSVLCEWRDGSHLNYGPGPQANPRNFLERVMSLVELEE